MTAAAPLTRTLYIPVEIVDRELGGAILLAAEAVRRGWRAVLGGKLGVFSNMSRFREAPGLFFLKSIVPGEVFKQKEILADGHRVTSLDVEGLVPSNGAEGVRLRYSPDSIQLADQVFFWGPNDFETVRAVYPQIAEKTVVSGSPIIDEIRVRGERAGGAGSKSGRKRILIGTSCGFANHINGMDFALQMGRDAYGPNISEASRRALHNQAMLDVRSFEFWQEAVPRIAAAFPECDVVLRPHPSENRGFWREKLKGLSNVSLNEGGPILDQLVKSDAYVHFNSTSSLTSMILGVPTFMPMFPMEADFAGMITFVKDLSVTAATPEELVSAIRPYLTAGKRYQAPDLSRYCANLAPGAAPAAARMMDAFEKRFTFAADAGRIVPRSLGEKFYVKAKWSKFFLMWCAGIALSSIGLKPGKAFPPRNAYKNRDAKQPPTSLDTLKRMMGDLLDADAISRISVEEKDRNLFVMTARAA